MVEKNTAATEEALERIENIKPPKESHVSTILNGIGNGAMVGALPVVLYDLYTKVVEKELTKPQRKLAGKVGVAMTVTGCILGAGFGKSEADRLREYRNGLNGEMTRLREDVDKKNAAIVKSWAEEQQKRAEHPKEPAHAL